MIPPLVSFVTWNRMALNIRSLMSLLSTTDDFELHIVDNNSRDDTWSYILDLKDNRIKSRIRYDVNRGHVYATNYILSKRRKDQYFVTIDSDVNIHTKDWFTQFMHVFNEFPEVGLLGAVTQEYYDRYRLPLIRHEKNSAAYLQLCKGFVEGCFQCLRPELLRVIGYWNEETCMGDTELCYRICNYTPFLAGFLPAVEIDQLQYIPCIECMERKWCKLDTQATNCFKMHDEIYKNPQFRSIYKRKYTQYIEEINRGKRTVYSASIHDEQSIEKYYYDKKIAEENFRYYINNCN